MPIERINGIRLHYEESGSGEPVVMVMGSGAGGRSWHLHQVPALRAAGRHYVETERNWPVSVARYQEIYGRLTRARSAKQAA